MLRVRRRAGRGLGMAGGVDPWSCKSLFVSCRIFLIVFCAFAAALVEEDRRLLPPPIDPACLAVTGHFWGSWAGFSGWGVVCVWGEESVVSRGRRIRADRHHRHGRAWRDGDACRGAGREGLIGGIDRQVRAAANGARLGVGQVDRCLGHLLDLLLLPLLPLPNCPRICPPF